MKSRLFHRFGRGRTPRRSLKTLLGPNARRLALEPLEARTLLASFTVNSIDDTVDANPGDGIAADAAGNTTLRAAIMEANALTGPDTIEFAIPGDGPHTIQPLSALPNISESLVIDGYTQAGATPNSNDVDEPINAALMIELDGSQAVDRPDGSKADGLKLYGANDSLVRGLVINRFAGKGIYFASDSGVVEGNFIGTDVTGTVDLGNSGIGIYIVFTHDVTVGGTGPGAGNVISGNDLFGVKISVTEGTKVEGNLIGTDRTGTEALANVAAGVFVDRSPGCLIGGMEPEARNVISGNGIGVDLRGSGITVQGNFIGTDITGKGAVGNVSYGIYSADGVSNNVIGGTADGAGNVISGNERGISFYGVTNNTVQGNFIGTDVTGTKALGNYHGLYMSRCSENLIGGTTPGARNVISGNLSSGITIDVGSTANVMQGNFIGTDVHGTGALGNDAPGFIVHDSCDNSIGGTGDGEGNTIAFNSDNGVEVRYQEGYLATGNSIRGNSIHSNGRLGIYLGPYPYSLPYGVTPNDPGDADTGPNNLQNFPVVTLAEPGSSTHVVGSLNSTPGTTFTIDFYANTVPDPTRYGEGERWVGAIQVTTDTSGNASFDTLLSGATTPGEVVTATATDAAGNTSEFSAAEVTINTPPVAVDDLVQMYGTSITVAAPGILANDSDPDWHSLTAVLEDEPTNGTLTLNSDGSATYTIGVGFDGTDSFTYYANDGRANSNLATVTVQHMLYVTNTNDSGDGSLRWTIDNASTHPGPDALTFAIPGDGPHTIQPLSALPIITESLVIDGYTQAGATPNTNPMDQAINAVLKIELDGSKAVDRPDGSKADGLKFQNQGANGSAVRGLVINRFAGNGISLFNSDSSVAEGNFIGTDVTGTFALGNGGIGIQIHAGSHTIGGTDPGARNLVSGNHTGIIVGLGTGSVVQGNFVGTDRTGTNALGNGLGVHIGSTHDVTLGGTAEGAGNLISGNLGYGVEVGVTERIKVQGNLIGTDRTGTAALGNVAVGVRVYLSPDCLIGGTEPGARNVISGNGTGVQLHNSHTTIQGNLIGTDITGSVALGNWRGIDSPAEGVSNNLIGGTTAGAGNVISGNDLGVVLGGTNNTVQGNFIGTDVTGSARLGNYTGVVVGGADNLIGGTTPEARNVVSGNKYYGIAFHAGVIGNVLQGNFIGTDATGAGALGNDLAGVWIECNSSNNTIGGTGEGEGNLIAFNPGSGVEIRYLAPSFVATGNSIRGNAIHSNGGLGIDLAIDGVTPNDPGDADTGPNNLQNFPLISAVESGTMTQIVGTLNSLADTAFGLDFYASSLADPSGFGEGERYLGSATVTTDGSGDATFDVALAVATSAGEVVTATATDPNGNTSEFSAGVLIVNTPPIANANGPYVGKEGSPTTFDASASSDPDGDPLQYRWDFDNDGTWDTAYSADSTATHTWHDDYSGTVVVEVYDGEYTDTDAAVVTVENLPPTVSVTGPDEGFRGDALWFDLAASDPSPVDQAATFTYEIDWDGNGTVDQTVSGAAAAAVDHVFSEGGTFAVGVWATDKDLGRSELVATHQITVKLPVLIDVKPGSDPNSVNIDSNGMIAVALFTTDDFDASWVNVDTLRFAGAAVDHWAYEDVDGDGDLDLMLHFRTQDTTLRQIYEDLLLDDLDEDGILDSTRQEAEVSLTGETVDEVIIEGSDELNLFLSGKNLREFLDELEAAGVLG